MCIRQSGSAISFLILALVSLFASISLAAESGQIVGWGSEAVGGDISKDCISVAAGDYFSLALKADGSIVAWGDGRWGQCDVPLPNSDFIAVSAGSNHCLGLKSDGSIVGWGGTFSCGELFFETPNYGFIAVATSKSHIPWSGDSDFGLGLKADGSIVAIDGFCDGRISGWGTPVPNSGFIAVAAGYNHCLGLKDDGTIVAWGDNNSGQCNVPLPNSDFIAVSAGINYNLGLKTNGSIVAWGYNNYGQCNVPVPNSGFVAIAAGVNHSLGLKADGSIVAWGNNDQGQCDVPLPNSGFIDMAAGGCHSLGIKADGSVVVWGRTTNAQLNIPMPNTEFVAVSTGGAHNLGLKADGSIAAWAANWFGECDVPAPNSGFVAVAAGGPEDWYRERGFSLGLKADGSIVAWGDNSFGECDVPLPNSDFIAVAGGGKHSLGLKAGGFIIAWGDNSNGQCDVPAPNSGFIAVAAGYDHSLGLKDDGSIVAWGNNNYGQCNVPLPNSNFIAVSASGSHSLGLKKDGSIVAWGRNEFRQCDIPSPNRDFVAIAAGNFHSLALKNDGSIIAWGDNRNSQCNVPNPNSGFVAVAAGELNNLALRGISSPLTYEIRWVSPTRTGNLGPTIVDIVGSDFKDGASVLVRRVGEELMPQSISHVSPFLLRTIFDFSGAQVGNYDVVVTNPDGESLTFPNTLEIVDSGKPHFWTKLTVPPEVRPGRKYTATIYYGNDGTAAMDTPILELSNSSGITMRLGNEGRVSSTNILLLGIPRDGTPDRLIPGSYGSIPISFITPPDGSIEFFLKEYQPDNTPFDWTGFESVFRPYGMSDEDWAMEWETIKQTMGETWSDVMEHIIQVLYYAPPDPQTTADFVGMLSFTMWAMNQPEGTPLPGDFNPKTDVTVLPYQGEIIPSATSTFILTHGWRDSSYGDAFFNLASKIKLHCPNANIILVDWTKGARTVLANPWGAAANIKAAGEEASSKLDQLLGKNFDFASIIYIGHSFGNKVNQVIAGFHDRKGKGIILDPANVTGGFGSDASPNYANYYLGKSLAVISDSYFDSGPCWPKGIRRRIADRQFHIHSDRWVAGHGKALVCFTQQIPINTECNNRWLKGTLGQELPQAPNGWYDGTIDCNGQIIEQAFDSCWDKEGPTIPGTTTDTSTTIVVRPIDPNEKRGVKGYDPEGTIVGQEKRFVGSDEPLTYTVYFENTPTATAPAQEIRIHDFLTPTLDWTTLELGEIVFGNQTVTALTDLVDGTTSVNLKDTPYRVDIQVAFDLYTGRLSWLLRTIDPNTNDLPADPQAGMLPPNDVTGRGEGHVSFTIAARADLATASIHNKATIFFDTEPPITTNLWTNTVDGAAPSSSVSPLLTKAPSPAFMVSWSGSDSGSGLDSYDIFVSSDGSDFQPWLQDSHATSAIFPGRLGSQYAFYSRAKDFVGNVESPPISFDAKTSVAPVDLQYFSLLAQQWMKSDCQPADGCLGADLDNSGSVDLNDLLILAENWMQGSM